MKALVCLAIGWILFVIPVLADEYVLFSDNGRMGVRDANGNVVIPARYESIGWSDGTFSVRQGVVGYQASGLWGVLSIKNVVVTQPSYIELQFAESIYLIASQKKYGTHVKAGCIDIYGKEIIPFQYESVAVKDQRAIVSKQVNNQYLYGLADMSNKAIAPVRYAEIRSLGSLRFTFKNAEGKFGLFTEHGEPLSDFLFDEIAPFQNGYSVATVGVLAGLLDRDGKWKVQPAYKAIRYTSNGQWEFLPYNQWDILDGQNRVTGTLNADSIESLGYNLFGISHNHTVRLSNAQFALVTNDHYQQINTFSGNKAIVRQPAGVGLITTSGEILIEPKYTSLIPDGAYVLAELRKDHWVLLDTMGNQKTPRAYESIDRFNGIYFSVRSKRHYGAISSNGREIIPCVYDSIIQYHNGKLVVKFHGQYGIIDLEETWVVPPQSDCPVIISADRYLIQKGPLLFLKSFSGNIIYFTNNELQQRGDHLEEQVSTGAIWTIDLDGRIINRQMPPESPYEKILLATEGLRAIKKDGRYGFIDDQGRLRVANRYEDTRPFQERMAPVRILGKWGFIDHDEKLVIQPVHDVTTDFQDGTAIVTQKKLQGIINTQGKVILPVRYEKVERLPTKRYLIHNDGWVGIADHDGRIITAPKYNSIVDLNNGYFIVMREGMYGLITTQGISTIPMQYNYLAYDTFNSRYLGMKRSKWTK